MFHMKSGTRRVIAGVVAIVLIAAMGVSLIAAMV